MPALVGSDSAFAPETYEFIRWLCYNEVVLPCLAATGGAAGMLIHMALRPLVRVWVGGEAGG